MSAFENFMGHIPILGPALGMETDAQKRLLEQQEKIAREADARRNTMQQARMNSLGNQMLAFDPRNKMMAQMFGPDAAFSPDQFAQMAADPMLGANLLPGDLERHTAGDPDPELNKRVQAYLAAQTADQERQAQVRGQMSDVSGMGPAPLEQRRPAAAKRF